MQLFWNAFSSHEKACLDFENTWNLLCPKKLRCSICVLGKSQEEARSLTITDHTLLRQSFLDCPHKIPNLLFVRGDYERKPQIYYHIPLYTWHFGDKLQHFISSFSQVLIFGNACCFCHAYSFPPFSWLSKWAQLPSTNTNPFIFCFSFI